MAGNRVVGFPDDASYNRSLEQIRRMRATASRGSGRRRQVPVLGGGGGSSGGGGSGGGGGDCCCDETDCLKIPGSTEQLAPSYYEFLVPSSFLCFCNPEIAVSGKVQLRQVDGADDTIWESSKFKCSTEIPRRIDCTVTATWRWVVPLSEECTGTGCTYTFSPDGTGLWRVTNYDCLNCNGCAAPEGGFPLDPEPGDTLTTACNPFDEEAPPPPPFWERVGVDDPECDCTPLPPDFDGTDDGDTTETTCAGTKISSASCDNECTFSVQYNEEGNPLSGKRFQQESSDCTDGCDCDDPEDVLGDPNDLGFETQHQVPCVGDDVVLVDTWWRLTIVPDRTYFGCDETKIELLQGDPESPSVVVTYNLCKPCGPVRGFCRPCTNTFCITTCGPTKCESEPPGLICLEAVIPAEECPVMACGHPVALRLSDFVLTEDLANVHLEDAATVIGWPAIHTAWDGEKILTNTTETPCLFALDLPPILIRTDYGVLCEGFPSGTGDLYIVCRITAILADDPDSPGDLIWQIWYATGYIAYANVDVPPCYEVGDAVDPLAADLNYATDGGDDPELIHIAGEDGCTDLTIDTWPGVEVPVTLELLDASDF